MLKDDPSIRLIARAYKMSKSRGNVINPDDVVFEYGADSLRLYEMFMGPLRYLSLSLLHPYPPFVAKTYRIAFIVCNRDSKQWSTSGIEGVHRFLARVWRLITGPPLPNGTFQDGTVTVNEKPSIEQHRCLHRTIEKVNTYSS